MTPAQVRETAHEIAFALRRRGYPIAGVHCAPDGSKASFVITRPDGRPWAFRVPPELLRLETVAGMTETYLD
jgi:hypothetical protein